ncbi:MAG: M23 family metallopeptidase, partial [bacterium]|nr:M23 family metallopeptidase [bacterium]
FYFDKEIELHRLEYSFMIGLPGNFRMYSPTVTVRPLVYPQKTPLFLLLKGRVLIEDGHDFYAHHRRLSMEHPIVKKLGIKSNAGRYAVDFCSADEKGKLYRNQGHRLEEWYGWAAPVYAPGSGKIVGMVADFPDNTYDEKGKVAQSKKVSLDNLLSFFGNFVTIDHGNGEFSVICHFKQDTIKVRKGQQVKTGDLLGEMGLSGSTGFPHIHYQLQDSPGVNGEGLPSYFRSYRRWLGARSILIEKGSLDSGDIVEGITRK